MLQLLLYGLTAAHAEFHRKLSLYSSLLVAPCCSLRHLCPARDGRCIITSNSAVQVSHSPPHSRYTLYHPVQCWPQSACPALIAQRAPPCACIYNSDPVKASRCLHPKPHCCYQCASEPLLRCTLALHSGKMYQAGGITSSPCLCCHQILTACYPMAANSSVACATGQQSPVLASSPRDQPHLPVSLD
jgi:hypothetical protein